MLLRNAEERVLDADSLPRWLELEPGNHWLVPISVNFEPTIAYRDLEIGFDLVYPTHESRQMERHYLSRVVLHFGLNPVEVTNARGLVFVHFVIRQLSLRIEPSSVLLDYWLVTLHWAQDRHLADLVLDLTLANDQNVIHIWRGEKLTCFVWEFFYLVTSCLLIVCRFDQMILKRQSNCCEDWDKNLEDKRKHWFMLMNPKWPWRTGS